LDWVHLPNLASNIGVGFQLFQPQNAIHFLPHGNISSGEPKWDGTQLSNVIRLHVEDDLDQAGKESWRVTTLNELACNLVSAFILEM
jgi:hypothetical protein